MNPHTHAIVSRLHLVMIAATCLCLSTAVQAGRCCPRCSAKCDFSVDEGEQSKHCWKVESERICVPNVVFPWQNRSLTKHCACSGTHRCSCTAECVCGCQIKHNGAFVIQVNKLKKHKFTCPRCEYHWEVRSPCQACTATCESEDATPSEEETSAHGEQSADEATNSAEDGGELAEPQLDTNGDDGQNANGAGNSTEEADPQGLFPAKSTRQGRSARQGPVIFEISDSPSNHKRKLRRRR